LTKTVPMAALLAVAMPTFADQLFLRESEAAHAIFGEHVTSVRETLELSAPEVAELSRILERKVEIRSYPYLEVRQESGGDAKPTLGEIFVIDVIGQSQPITFAVGVKEDGTLQDVQVMVYREPHGDEIRERRFRAQFAGKKLQDPLVVGKDIDAISGATISSNSAAYAARKGLALADILRRRSIRKPQ
jgi:Na+-translocating ferredoxin:NAD+ oxidoreductase RnfG subunit